MYALVRREDGTVYPSPVFGYGCESGTSGAHGAYYIVLDERGERLKKQRMFDPEAEFLEPRIHIVDDSCHGWRLDRDGYGCVDYLVGVATDGADITPPEPILALCREVARTQSYRETVDIRTPHDIACFLTTFGGMHDLCVQSVTREGDELYVLFDGCWGLKCELWLSGDVAYSLAARSYAMQDNAWFDATLCRAGEYLYLIDQAGVSPEQITPALCYFRAKHMRYRAVVKPY